jgi:hypothetical protein
MQLFLLISYKNLQKKQVFEMTSRKNGIRLTVNGLGVPPPFAKRVIKIIKSIPGSPRLGRIVPEYNDDNLRERIYGNYRIIYRIKPETIEIAAICHGSRLLENVFEP